MVGAARLDVFYAPTGATGVRSVIPIELPDEARVRVCRSIVISRGWGSATRTAIRAENHLRRHSIAERRTSSTQSVHGVVPLPAGFGAVGGIVGMVILYGVGQNAAVVIYQAVGLLVPLVSGGIAYGLLRRSLGQLQSEEVETVATGGQPVGLASTLLAMTVR